MSKRMYEGMFLLDSNRYARDPKGVSTQITDMLEKLGADIQVSRLWNEQRLAYPIRGHRKGTYWLTYFRMGGSELPKLKRESQLNENILRSLVVTVDERLADTLVQHAATGATTAAGITANRSEKDDDDQTRDKPDHDSKHSGRPEAAHGRKPARTGSDRP